ncbi:hypothetical protein [Tenacibaculum piscium]|uniref:hypothetical protein n=1 Tax=Tenacibaculum piscium TaxID=1458515 RepID=UPI00187B6D23|nr:hypothetical protein [Tenacibaculum piscium]MBE7691236.1 hypothetical protein [Tenacibaculum piscium]
MIKLSTFENNQLETIRVISASQFENLKNDCEIINDSHKQLVVFKYLQLNIKEYSKFIKKISELYVAQLDIRVLTSESLLLETNRLVLNYTSSFKFFLDNGKTFLIRKYGKDSQITSDFLTLCSKHYDENFAYRFLTNLRDYSMHIGFPLTGLGFKAKKNEKNPEKMVGEIQLMVDINTIKTEKKTFRGVYKELINFTEDIDLKPLFYQLFQSILDIQEYIYLVQKEEIEQAINNIQLFVGDFKTKENDIKVFHSIERENNEIELGIYSVPFDKIKDFEMYRIGTDKNRC